MKKTAKITKKQWSKPSNMILQWVSQKQHWFEAIQNHSGQCNCGQLDHTVYGRGQCRKHTNTVKESLPNANVLDAVSSGKQAVKLCSRVILQLLTEGVD